MASEVVASPAPDCPSPLCIWVTDIAPATVVLALFTLIGVFIYKEIHNGMRLLVREVSLENGNNSQNGNVTLQFTLREENLTSRSVTYHNITGTLAVLNEDPFLTQFTPTQVSMPHIHAADNSIALVLMLNGTMETSSHSYRCCISTSEYYKPCSPVRSK